MPATVTDIVADTKINIQDLTRIEDFLRTGKCKHEYEGGAIVRDASDDLFLCKGGEFLELDKEILDDETTDSRFIVVTKEELSDSGKHRNEAEAHDGSCVKLPSGVLVAGGRKGWRSTLLICGDADDFEFIEVKKGTPAPTISFLCLSRFIDDAKPLELAAMLHSGKIKVLDFTTDETRKVSAADLKRYKDKKLMSPPAPGFTYLPQGVPVWHRAATVLLRSGRMRILLGQDDGTYFGCELKGSPNTVKAAFESLVPAHLRKAKGLKRQGEWFIVPVGQKNVPAVTECVALADENISLPVDDKESARHMLWSTDIRVAKDGRIFAIAGCLVHSEEDHPDVAMPRDQWHTFDRNTAVRSFSQEGVD